MLVEKNTNELLHFTQNLKNPEQLFYQTARGWNGIQILEHIYLTDSLIAELITQSPEGIADSLNFFGENRLKQLLVEEQVPVKSPVFLIPRNKITTLKEFNEKFNIIRQQFRKSVLDNEHLNNKRFYRHPLMGEMTLSDWLLFIVFHTQRHMQQLDRLMQIKFS